MPVAIRATESWQPGSSAGTAFPNTGPPLANQPRMNEHPPIWQYKVIYINVEGDAATTNPVSASPQPGSCQER